MALRFAELMFTPAVKAEQDRHGSRAAYARMERDDAPPRDRLGPNEAAFIAARDSFYLASVGETGWPYVQHRGGPPGFLVVLDNQMLGFADFSGNRQYVSLGNLAVDDRVALFLMDYRNQRRLKILGHARAVETGADPALIGRLTMPAYRAKVERGLVIALEGFDWNCSQHNNPRFTEAEVHEAVAPLRDRLVQAEAERDELRSRLAAFDAIRPQG